MTTLAGTRGLIRLILRRDRFLLPLWVLVQALLPIETAAGINQFYDTPAALRELYGTITGTPGLLAMLGPVFGATLGAITAWRAGLVFTVVGLASLLTVIRHTRSDEEAGRRELLGSTVVGRNAPLTAALLVTLAADLVLGAVLAAGMVGLGLPATGSVAYGLSVAAAGWMFAAVGAVAAQLTDGAGGARGIALGALGVAYMLRAAGDTGGSDSGVGWLSWLSPIGWAQQTRSYADERWWVFALVVTLVVVLATVAGALLARRDVGAGVMAARLGPATAAAGLRSPLALAWRLHRTALIAWTAGLALMGALIGSVADSVKNMASESSQLKDMLEWLGGEKVLSDAYIAGALVQVPAVLVLSGIAMALFGLLPRLASVSWAALAVSAFLVLIGPMLRLSHWLLDVAPFSHIPKVPGADVSATPLAWLLGIAVVLAAAGLAGFRRRDLVSTA